jgi:GR25 family glycosyltransferase involved in LPS biosynthesis
MSYTILVIFLCILLYLTKREVNVENFTSINKEEFVDNNLDIFYINLDKSKDRREKMEKQLKLNNFKYKRFPAYNGKMIKSNFKNSLSKDFNIINKKGFIFNKKKGSLGNFISQLTCWYNFYKKSNKKYIMVMEDDIVFNGLNKKVIFDVLNGLKNENWTMVKFFCFSSHKKVGDDYNDLLVKTQINWKNHKNKQNTGMQCYIINRNNIMKLIEDLLPIHNDTFDIKVKLMMDKHDIFITKKDYVLTPDHNNQSDRKKMDYS